MQQALDDLLLASAKRDAAQAAPAHYNLDYKKLCIERDIAYNRLVRKIAVLQSQLSRAKLAMKAMT